MINLIGFRTFLVAVMGSWIVPLAAKHGLALSPDQQTWIVGLGMGALMVVMRLLTKTAPGAKPDVPPSGPASKQAGRSNVSFLIALVALVIVGCQALGLATPRTFEQQYATGVSACTAALTTADTLMKAHKLQPKDAQNVEKQVDNVKEALDIANTIHATDAATGNNKLAAALGALQAVQTYLTQAQGT